MKQQQPTLVARPQWLADHPRLGEDILDTRAQQPDHGAMRRSYMAPHSTVFLVETPNHFLQASFSGGGGHNPGGDGGEIIGAKGFDFEEDAKGFGFEEDADPDNAWDF